MYLVISISFLHSDFDCTYISVDTTGMFNWLNDAIL